ncbi:polymorphic toxin type 33 domain-containing protein [Aerosakkonemataceae cyanobacterium BLCC-F154]|uniref:Polymorphic toxin type 33 domain-containing protein n=1 Tax=Floridaenema fluviatile BLCC-F154 TaxID=3153640 RepID=A0ABV4Y6T3_9CYAN
MAEIESEGGEHERNWRQDKLLTSGEVAKLQREGIDIHALKNEESASKKDLYKDRDGNIYVKPKRGQAPGENTGLNINDF